MGERQSFKLKLTFWSISPFERPFGQSEQNALLSKTHVFLTTCWITWIPMPFWTPWFCQPVWGWDSSMSVVRVLRGDGRHDVDADAWQSGDQRQSGRQRRHDEGKNQDVPRSRGSRSRVRTNGRNQNNNCDIYEISFLQLTSICQSIFFTTSSY